MHPLRPRPLALLVLWAIAGGPAPAPAPARAADEAPAKKEAPAPKPKREPRMTPDDKHREHDMNRPRPKVVDPGPAPPPAPVPSDAVVLFDGKDLSAWESRLKGQAGPAAWKVEDGYFEVVPRAGSLTSKQTFGDCQIHLEWATPAEVNGRGQGRGNSGLMLGGFGEVQLLDSVDNDTYPDGQNAALYGKYPPRVNASRGPGQWQTFDVFVESAEVDDQGLVARLSRLTMVHNGVLVHHAVEFPGRQGAFAIGLQDHGNPVRFRNVWVRPLKGYDEDGTPPPSPAGR